MSTLRFIVRQRFVAVALLLLSSALPSANAAFHMWFIKEIYTNSTGSVQFVELFNEFPNEQFVMGLTLTSNSNTFTFPTNTPAGTENHHLLLATPGFGSLPGAVTPDFTLPINFFSTSGDTLNYGSGFDVRTFVPLTDGVNSLNYSSTSSPVTFATNSPTNFAGATGSVNLVPEPASGLVLLGFAALGLVGRRR